MNGRISQAALHGVAAAYVLYAQGLLPFLLPLSVLLIEPMRRLRRRMMGFLMLGSALGLYILWGLITDPLQVYAVGHSIVYNNPLTTNKAVAMLIMSYAFTSVWCAYAAVVSVVIYFFFRRSSARRPAKCLLAA
ncbi:MAG: hypothetical protein ACYCOR_16485 [Acidobacteriaceae bacterium]